VVGTDDNGSSIQSASPESVALYIGAMTQELGQLARANGLDALGYLLDMVRLEADEAAKGSSEKEQWVDSAEPRRAG
jgi:hypothetical protein